MARYRIDAIVTSDTRMDEEGEYIEAALESFDVGLIVNDLVIYEVCHLPSDAERAREARRAEWTNSS